MVGGTPWSTPDTNAGGADRAATPAASALVTPNDVGRWITLDLRALVQGWVNAPGTNHGVLLRTTAAIPNGGIVTYSFAASEYGETARRPKLTVILAPGTPAPTSTPTPQPGPTCVALYLEAEQGALSGQYTTGPDSGCSACNYAWVPEGAGNNDGSAVTLAFYVPQSTLYYLWGRTRAPDWHSYRQKICLDGSPARDWLFPNVEGGWS